MSDTDELLCELHHIAGTESVDHDIRRTACKAELAIDTLRAEIARLRLTDEERWTLQTVRDRYASHDEDEDFSQIATTIDALLARLGGGA